jgi:hypothetical protein
MRNDKLNFKMLNENSDLEGQNMKPGPKYFFPDKQKTKFEEIQHTSADHFIQPLEPLELE